jgi:hypothetical protein
MHEADRAWRGAGYRGAVALKLSVRTSSSDLHSGSYGGSVANAAHVLSSLLSELHRPEDGAVAAPRFYDDVVPLTPEQRAAFEALALNETEDKAAAGALLLRVSLVRRMRGRLTCAAAASQVCRRTMARAGSARWSAGGARASCVEMINAPRLLHISSSTD